MQRYATRRTVITIRQKKGCLRTKYAHLSSQVEARPRLHAGCSRCALTVHQCCNPSHFECTSAAISKNCPIEVSLIFILPTIFTSKQYRFAIAFLSLQRSRNENFIGNKLEKTEESIFHSKRYILQN